MASINQQIQARWRALRGIFLLCALASPLLVACGQPQAQHAPLKVVATIAPLADWARQVGQAHVTVTQLVPAGIDPRDYTLSEADRRALAEVDVLLYNGLGLEPWLTDAVPKAKAQELVALELAQFIGNTRAARNARLPFTERGNNAQQSGGGLEDLEDVGLSPYLWLDPGPNMAQFAVSLIADTFTRADTDHLLAFRRNAERYNGELENFDNWVRRESRSWPRVRVGRSDMLAIQTLDHGWAYFAQRYGINLRVLNPAQTTSPRPTSSMPLFVDQFMRPSEHVALLSLRQPDGVLKPLGHDNYLQLMRDNVDTIARGMRRVARTEATRARQLYETQ